MLLNISVNCRVIRLVSGRGLLAVVSAIVQSCMMLPRAAANTAYQLVNAGELPQAIALFQYGISLYPATPDAYNGLAYGYEQNKQYQQALDQVNSALALAKPGYEGYQVYVARKARMLQLLGQ